MRWEQEGEERDEGEEGKKEEEKKRGIRAREGRRGREGRGERRTGGGVRRTGRGRGKRFGYQNDQYYFKSKDEMIDLFGDIPESLTNISILLDQIEDYNLERQVVLPNYNVPEKFIVDNDVKKSQNNFLKKITYDGAKNKYGEINDNINTTEIN